MYESGTVLQFCGLTLIAVALFAAIRLILFRQILEGSMSLQPWQQKEPASLKPPELAYLLRAGDMSHTMIVLAVDLIQRSLKSQASDNSGLKLEPYEDLIWSDVKDFTRHWAQQKIAQVIPLSRPQGFLGWLVGIKAVKTFLTETLLRTIRELLKDPRHLRKYFSAAGVARLAMDLYASGYKDIIESNLKQELLSRGLIVEESRRTTFSSIFSLFAAASLLSFCGLSLLLPLRYNQLALVALLTMGFLNAALIRAVRFVPSLLPAYEEFRQVIFEIERNSFRFSVFRTTFRLANFMLLSLLLALLGMGVLVELTISKLILAVPEVASAGLIASFTCAGLLFIQLLLDSHNLRWHEFPTGRALGAVKCAKCKIAARSPIQCLRQVLTDPEYDPTFSEVVAIYGIETLWLLS